MRVSNIDKIRKGNKTVWDVKQERDGGRARLLNFGNNNTVEMYWGMNESSIREQIFILKIGDKEAYLSAEEMRRFLRWT